jgi:hypothetical protein
MPKPLQVAQRKTVLAGLCAIPYSKLHAELEGAGLTVVTIDMDIYIEAGRPSVEAANATRPSLIDPVLAVVDVFGITNVPFGLWVDGQGLIVRTPEVAYALRDRERSAGWQSQEQVIEQMDPEWRALIQAMAKQTTGEMSRYADAVRDWLPKEPTMGMGGSDAGETNPLIGVRVLGPCIWH